MSEMIERAAEAIRLRAMVRGYSVPAPVLHHLAAAAIEAMREPTAAMTDAAHASSLCGDEPMGPDFPAINTRIYRAMIDAALTSGVGNCK
jgi:hypothetical protein